MGSSAPRTRALELWRHSDVRGNHTVGGQLGAETEEAGFYHEAGLNAAWTASRLAIGGLCFLFGTFVFAYFYLRSVNS